MQTLILGLDAFDPAIFERLSALGKLPNLTKYVDADGYARFSVSNPPQSEVSWTSIATGLNPGGHGIFDFVHRNPDTYNLYVSLLPTKRGLGGTQFAQPHTAQTIFDYAARQGYPATALWWPAMFPARPGSPARTLPGLGTPDLHGRWGVGTLFSTNAELTDGKGKTVVVALEDCGANRYRGRLSGPIRKKRKVFQESTLDLNIEITSDTSAHLTIGKCSIGLTKGKWSPILELSFQVGTLLRVHALTRVLLTQVEPEVKLYILPLQVHPLYPLWPYATHSGFAKQIWKNCGAFLTLGWPQDTTGLEDSYITDNQFIHLCESIFRTRESILMDQLKHFQEGLLASVFDTLDRIQHMFWRDRPDIIEDWYVKIDALVGRVEQQLAEFGKGQCRIVIVSDHGFADFDYQVHLNHWLVEQGYLVMKDGTTSNSLKDAHWLKSQAYAIGLNSLYLNLEGREGQGCIQASQKESLLKRIQTELLGWHGPDGHPVVQQVLRQSQTFDGALADHGPDIVVGYSSGYRASAQTGLGEWNSISIEPNCDHWGGDHCIDAQAVPGVLFANQDLSNYPQPSYRDFPALATGVELDPNYEISSLSFDDEDEAAVEERLKSLGYL